MTTVIDYSSRQFPKRIPEKLKTIRERLGLTPDEIAPLVGARTGAEILAYENDEDDLLVSVLFGYAKIANMPVKNLLHDDRDLWFEHRVTEKPRDDFGERSVYGTSTIVSLPAKGRPSNVLPCTRTTFVLVSWRACVLT